MTNLTISDADRALMKDIEADTEALARLKDKANWEQCTLFAALEKFGDPRNWPKPGSTE